MKPQFGMLVRDINTGFEGVITGITSYMNNPIEQVLIAQGVDRNGKVPEPMPPNHHLDGRWFGADGIEEVKEPQ